MLLVKNLKFSVSLFFLKMDLDKLYDYVRHGKRGFVDYKNDIRAKSKNRHFLKRLNHGFGQNLKFPLSLFLVFFFIFLDILFGYLLDRKQGFQEYYNDVKTKSRNCHFSKGVNPWFWSKI